MKRATLLVTFGMLVFVLTAGFVSAQELEWVTWDSADGGNDHEYAVIMQEATWLEQKAAAEALGGYLATVSSAEEEDFVFGLIRMAEEDPEAGPSSHDFYAFGLEQTDRTNEPAGGWHWVTGEPLNWDSVTGWEGYVKWGYREPNNYRNIEHYGCIHRSENWWNDGRDNKPYRAVVEREGEPPVQDTTPPETGLSEPVPSVLTWSDAPTEVILSGSVIDTESGVASAMLTIDDEYDELDSTLDLIALGLLGEDGSFTTSVDLASIVHSGDADGRIYTISLDASDSAGNAAATISVSVTAPPDETAPSMGLNAPSPSELAWSNTPTAVTIGGSAIDAESGLKSATLTIDDEYDELDRTLDLIAGNLLGEDGSFSTTVDLAAVARPDEDDGRIYTISLDGADHAGNVAATLSVSVIVPPDTNPPTVVLNEPEPSQLPWRDHDILKLVIITGTAIDNETGMDSVLLDITDEYGEFSATDVPTELHPDGTFSAELLLSSRADGSDSDGRIYEIAATAFDKAGNLSQSNTVTVLSQRPSQTPGNGTGSSGNDTPPGQDNRPDTPPGHDKRPDNPHRRGR